MAKQSSKVEFLGNGVIKITHGSGLAGLYDDMTGRHVGLFYSERGEQLAKFATLGMISEGWH